MPTQDLEAQGRGQGWVLACAVRLSSASHPVPMGMEAGNHQVPYFSDNGVKSTGTHYSGCHFGKFAQSVLHPLCSVSA